MPINMTAGNTPLDQNFKIKKRVTLPLIKLPENKEVYLRPLEPMKQAEQSKNPKKDANGNVIPPPFVMKVEDFENHVEGTIVVNSVMQEELTKQYPNDGYVGKYFAFTKVTKAEGKRYNTFGITELEPESQEQEAAPVKGKK